MKTIKPNWIICTLIFISMSSFAQNPSIFILQTLPVDNTYLAEKCNTSDLIIFISCKIPGLSFESNVIKTDSFKQFFNPDREEYIICHSMEPFMLTINCPGYESRDEPIDGLKSRYKFKITGKLVMGVVNFISKPKGASVQFFGMTEFPTPSTQRMATGEYPATMRKNGYKTLDTTVVFSPDVTKDLTFELKPDFPSLKFDIQSIDSLDFTEPPVLIVDTDTIILDGYVNKGKKLASFDNDLAYNTVYENNLIPVKPGDHKIKIEATGFNAFELPESLRFDKGKITPLKARLLPVYGTLNVIDDENNEGANIFLDDRLIGKAPLVEYKVRIGKYKVRLVKPGYKMMADYYDATIVQNGAFDLPVALYVSKQIYLVSIPTRANVYLEGAKLEGVKDTLFGSTPFKRILQKGKYTLRFEKSGGFVPEKYYLEIDETSKDNDTIRFPMRKGYPLIIKSETSDLALEIHGLNSGPDSLANIVINQNLKTPAPLNIPFGKYSVILREGNLKRFHGKIKHDPKNIGEIKLPCYSNKSFKPLVADFISTDNFELSFGQSYFFGFTGLSTAIFNVQYFAKKQVDEFGVNTGEKISMLIPNIFLLNWDFRIGGAIMRNLDICALGRIKYTPGLKAADLNIPGYNDATMLTGFYGIELSSRFSYLNINCKAGIQQLSGTCNVWNTNEKKYTEGIKINEMNPVVSFGITINGYISGSNNMLRLWHQPPVNLLKKFAYSKMKRNSKKGAAVGK